VRAKFTAFYTASVKDADIIIGADAQGVRVLQNNIVQSFAHGDGISTIDGQARAILLAYSITRDEIFILKDLIGTAFDNLSNTGKQGIGDFIESEREVKVTNYFRQYSGMTTIQQTVNGIFLSNGGFNIGYFANVSFVAADGTPNIGALVDSNAVIPPGDKSIPTIVPSEYGSLRSGMPLTDAFGVKYYNYQRGCIKATPNGSEWMFKNYPGRNFNATSFEPELLSLETIFNTTTANLPNIFTGTGYNLTWQAGESAQWLREQFLAAYRYWHEQGFFIGFRENVDNMLRGWQTSPVVAQFMFGDSVANPFNDNRWNIAALVFNSNDRKIYLIEGGALTIWATPNQSTWGMPIENPQPITGTNYRTQRLSTGNMFVYNGSFTSYVVASGLVTNFGANAVAWFSAPSHGNNINNGYIGPNGEHVIGSLHLPPGVVLPTGTSVNLASRMNNLFGTNISQGVWITIIAVSILMILSAAATLTIVMIRRKK
jgi:hypothetical protein